MDGSHRALLQSPPLGYWRYRKGTEVTRPDRRFFFIAVPSSIFFLCWLTVLWIGTCMAEESPPLPELRAEAKAEREGELLYLKEEIVSIAVRHAQPISSGRMMGWLTVRY